MMTDNETDDQLAEDELHIINSIISYTDTFIEKLRRQRDLTDEAIDKFVKQKEVKCKERQVLIDRLGKNRGQDD